MLNFFYRALNNKKGFTLIEVLVVVAIIGILAALAAPRIIGRIDAANMAHDEALAKTLNDAMEQYKLDDPDGNGPSYSPVATDLEDYVDNATWNWIKDMTTWPANFEGKYTDGHIEINAVTKVQTIGGNTITSTSWNFQFIAAPTAPVVPD